MNLLHMRKDSSANSMARRALAFGAVAFFQGILSISALAAQMTQEDVFKSIKENVSDTPDSNRSLLAIVLGAAGVVMLLAVFSSRSKREVAPQTLNHPGKLLKELSRQAQLRPAELKQLRLLAEAEQQAGVDIQSPVIFLLCPSTLTAAMRSNRVKVDRKVMAGLARKMGLLTGKKS